MSFEFDGEKYKKASKHQTEWANKILQELHLIGDESILDLGCGDGRITYQLAQMVSNGRVIGIDASEGMIDCAVKNNDLKNLSFLKKDINNMVFTDEFDLIFSNAALHWILDHNKLLNNIYKALKDNGIVRLNFASEGNCSNFFQVIKKAMSQEEYAQYFKNYQWPWFMPSIKEYEEIMKGVQFMEVAIWEENADRYFQDSEEMIRWIDQPSIVPFLKYLPDHLKKSFRAYVIDEMLRRTQQNDGRCFETFRRINIKARK